MKEKTFTMGKTKTKTSVVEKKKKLKPVKELKTLKKKKRLPTRKSILTFASSAWIIFSRKYRTEIRLGIKKEQPDIADDKLFGLTCKALAAKWKVLSTEDREPFYVAYRQDKIRYENDKANLTKDQVKTLRQLQREKRKKRREGPDPRKSAYMMFVKHQRKNIVEKHPDLDFANIGRELGKVWTTMSAEDRVEFEAEAELDRIRYLKEMVVHKTQLAASKNKSKATK